MVELGEGEGGVDASNLSIRDEKGELGVGIRDGRPPRLLHMILTNTTISPLYQKMADDRED